MVAAKGYAVSRRQIVTLATFLVVAATWRLNLVEVPFWGCAPASVGRGRRTMRCAYAN